MKPSIARLLTSNPWARAWLLAAALAAAVSTAIAEPLSDQTRQQIQALQAEKEGRTPAQKKLDSQLVYALKQSRNQLIAPGVTNLLVFLERQPDGRVLVDIDATITADLLDFIRATGGTVINSFPQFKAARLIIPLSLAEALGARSEVVFVRPAYKPEHDTGSVTSEGDITETAAFARSAFNANGSGVKVGVLSDSVDFLANSQSTGDLPPNVTVLAGQSGVPSTGEGTAMLEIIYDLAPGAQLFFATAGGGTANFANNILALRAAGCDIIVDDIRYATEPPLQDGIVARAVNTVTANGALYFASAGNSGNKAHGTSGTWEGDFADGGPVTTPVDPKGGRLHSFGANTYNTLTIAGSAALLWWSDPMGASTNDYDFYVLDGNNQLLGASTNPQTGTQDPFEGLVGFFTNNLRFVVVKASGADRFLHIDSGRGELEVNTTGFARGHSAATNAFATAAIDVATSFPQPFVGGGQNPVEFFSSDGPRRMFYQQDGTPITPGNYLSTGGAVRQYPTIGASDGVQTSVPGFNPFFGTSAAAPHAAAIATLLKSYNPALNPDDIRAILTSTALDNEAPGLDITGGYGILMAHAALAAAPPPLPIPNLVVVSNFVYGGNGDGIIDYDECNNLDLTLANIGRADATGVHVTLVTATPGVSIAQGNANYPTIVTNATGTNLVSFKISTAPEFVCGTPINLTLLIKCDQTALTTQVRLPTGRLGTTLRFDSFTTTPIPDPGTTNSIILVSNIDFAISKVNVSLYLTHTFDSDLVIQLVSPGGLTNTLARHRGLNGQNYGLSCNPDSLRTTFDDGSPNSIRSGVAPFLGSYQPENPLAIFAGKSGTNVNGIWRLLVSDTVPFDTGAIQCWSLLFTPTFCATNGGGECPGSDLAVGITAAPEPVLVQNTLTYTISVTNKGPSGAKSVSVSQVLPSSAGFVSASTSQGSAAQNGGVVTASLGRLSSGGTATVTVIVTNRAVGIVSSSATASSEQADFDLSNNSATAFTTVNPLTADLGLGLTAAPGSLLMGDNVTFTLSVTNNGPSDASGVFVTNIFPAGLALLGETISQGTLTVAGNTVVCILGALSSGARATATITATPTATGTMVASARLNANPNQFDPNTANNSALAVVAVGPAADLALTITALPNPVVIGSNLTFITTVTNLGPSPATAVVLQQTLPPLVTILSTNLSQGTASINGTNMTCQLGTLGPGAGAIVTLVVAPTYQSSNLLATASVAATEADRNLANNSAFVSVLVAQPFITIVPAGATLTAESFSPPDGTVEPGEIVTISFRLQNVGNVANTNLTATLLATGGVTSITTAPQTYGRLKPVGVPGGVPGARSFSFTANGTNGGVIVATLQLADAGNPLPPATFIFSLPTLSSFTNGNAIAVPATAYTPLPGSGPANPYPSTINVSGLSGQVGKVTLTLANLAHTDPHDINVLLVGPTGAKSLLLSHAGEGAQITNVTFTLDDSASAGPISELGVISPGSWQPSVYGNTPGFPNPAPAGPYPTSLGNFGSLNPNGTWSLFVFDDSDGDYGNIASGWSLNFVNVTPVNQLADVGLRVSTPTNRVYAGDTLAYTFTVTNAGPSTANNVIFSDPLPASVSVMSASVSQGNYQLNGNLVTGNLASVAVGGTATISVIIKPTVAAVGILTNTASVSAAETDLRPTDNSASIATTVTLPIADLVLGLSASTSVVTVGSNLTYAIAVTNLGPGKALNVMVTNSLPPSTLYITNTTSQGSVSVQAGIVTIALGDLPNGASATMGLTVSPVSVGLLTNTTTAYTASSDPANANNSAVAIVSAVAPTAVILPAGAVFLAESLVPDGTIEPGETVTVSFGLTNAGNVDTANLVATLQQANGVTAPSGPISYGHLVAGGAAASRSFSFTASPSASGTVLATLQLQDGVKNLNSAAFTFVLPVTNSFANTNGIHIPDHGPATPYPSAINVTGLTGYVSKVTVALHGLGHSFPSDVNVLLVSPAGRNVLLMSHAGGPYSLTNVDLTFDDAAAASLPFGARILPGTYKPTKYGGIAGFPYPAPVPPRGTTLSAVNGTDPNGLWSLYVLDDSAGDSGTILGGWSMNLTVVNPVAPVADLAASMTGTPSSVAIGDVVTYTITVTNLGPASAPGVVVSDTLPAGFTVLSNYTSVGSVMLFNGTLTGNLGTLDVGTSAVLVFVTSPSISGSTINNAAFSGGYTDLNPANSNPQAIVLVAVSARPTLTGLLSGGIFRLTINGEPNTSYQIQASTNLSTWQSLGSYVTPGTGVLTVPDPSSPNFRSRYYRALRQ